jgi:hypothetical protein
MMSWVFFSNKFIFLYELFSQSNKLKKLDLNEKIKKRKTRFRHHPYIQP